MVSTRTFTPNAQGNLAFTLRLVGGNALDEEWQYSDYNTATASTVGLKDFSGWSKFTMRFSDKASDATTYLLKEWTSGEAIVGAASSGILRVYLTATDTAALQASGKTHGFCSLEGTNAAGDKRPLESGRWHLEARPGV